MKKALETLVELQRIDSNLLSLEKKRGDLPKEIAELEEDIHKLEEEIDLKNAKNEDENSLLTKQAGQVDILRGKLEKYQKQLYQVKNNKEYDAITLEIEEAEAAIESLEFNNLEIEEAITEREKELDELHKKFSELKDELQERQIRLEKLLAKTRAKETVLDKERESIKPKLPRSIFSMYERIRQARDGEALAYLKNGACSACSSRIPPQRGVEIRAMNQLFVCEVCGRILVYDPNVKESPVTEKN